jgi:hypothetical protein
MPSQGRRRQRQVAGVEARNFVCGIPGSPGGQMWVYGVEIHTGHWKEGFGSKGPKKYDDFPCAALSYTSN